MNYLAHAYLSFNQPPIIVGNMISDYVKGKQKFEYPPAILDGIMLHRYIDEFTDSHPITQEAKVFFRPHYRLYAGAFVDVLYDHFLANDLQSFNNPAALQQFATGIYSTLQSNLQWLPERFKRQLPYMEQQNWLYNYRFNDGIEKSFGGLVKRAVYMSDSGPAFKIFEAKYDIFQKCYHAFFPELKQFTKKTLDDMTDSASR